MNVVKTIAELKEIVQVAKAQGKTIGLIPTMGFLHEGHLTLAANARKECDVVIMSVFVNPTQFGPNEDFDSYPRDLPRDVELASSVGVDVIFAPAVEEMYPTDGGIRIVAGRQSTILCGATRPGHFDGVLQVVSKLFHLAQPTRAYFGQKDAQQVAIVSTMVRDFNFPLELRVVPIVREEDGLAKSSRNVYLTVQDRREAPAIFAALQLAKNSFEVNRDVASAIQTARAHIEENTSGRIDYLEMLAYPDLTVANKDSRELLIAVAVYIGKTRLIDNVIVTVGEEK